MNGVAPPTFIIGIMERSGTNFLADALKLLDPRFQLPRALGEDFLLEHSNLLNDYIERTYQRWKRVPWLNNPDEYKELLSHQLGQALLALLYEQIDPDKRLLTKTPNASNVDKFCQLFPQAKLLILVRDGRDVVESAAATWPSEPYGYWVNQWARGARSILDFIRGPAHELHGSLWELVRYEDLVQKPQAVADKLLRFLELDKSRADYHLIDKLPIRASSQDRDEAGKVTWATIEKHNGFNPIGRWSSWSWYRKKQFKRLAGQALIDLGYVPNNRW